MDNYFHNTTFRETQKMLNEPDTNKLITQIETTHKGKYACPKVTLTLTLQPFNRYVVDNVCGLQLRLQNKRSKNHNNASIYIHHHHWLILRLEY